MAWVFLWLALAAAVAGVVLVAYRGPLRNRLDRANIAGGVLALLAVPVAGVGSYLAASDRTIDFQPTATLLLANAIVAAAAGLYALRGRPGRAALLLAGAGVFWLVLGAAALPFEVAVSACACSSAGPDYIPPTIATLDARGWIMFGDIVGPALLFIGSRLVAGGKASAT